jgi:signal transduction histidine kinase
VEELALLASIADQIGIAVENIYLRRQTAQAAVVEERERLARDLHDSVTQSLYSLTLFAETGLKLLVTGQLDSVRHYLDRVNETALQALKEMRLMVYELRPLDLSQNGLIGALHRRLSAVEKRVGINARLVADELIELPPYVEEELYRIAQEALNNALKYGTATGLTVYLRLKEERVELEITDNGTGFDLKQAEKSGGMGLHNMRERAKRLDGTLTIATAPEEGTRVKVTINLNEMHNVLGAEFNDRYNSYFDSR